MRVEPYLYFDGRCDEAVELYRRALGAEVTALVRFKDNPGTLAPAGADDKVTHASLRFGETPVLASDGQSRGGPNFQGFSLSLTREDADGQLYAKRPARRSCVHQLCRFNM